MGMLTNFEDKYMMCPVFKHIINREPIVGDFIVTFWTKGIVQQVNEPKDDNDIKSYNIKELYVHSTRSLSYCDTSVEITSSYNDFVIITKELFEMILYNIPNDTYEKIRDIVIQHGEYDDNPFHSKYKTYMLLYRCYTYLSSIVSDEMDKMILLSTGIKKVLKKHKNNGFRDVLLGNGQVWRLKKNKKKGFYAKQIRKKNKRYENLHKKFREKSVSYCFIKRLDKEYEAIIS